MQIDTRSGQANKATVWTIVGLIVLVTAGVIIAGAYSSSNSANSANANFVATTAPAISSTDWAEGDPHAKVMLIEYGDYECPACGEYFPVVQQIQKNFSSTLLFVFRDFPLTTIHPFAQVSAEAAEAAGYVGGPSKFWAMHDMLYAKQNEWSVNSALSPASVTAQFFNGYAQSIGLDVVRFDAAMNATPVLEKIQNDLNGGNAAQIDHTPTFFVDGTQIPNPTSMQDFENTLSAALASSTAKR